MERQRAIKKGFRRARIEFELTRRVLLCEGKSCYVLGVLRRGVSTGAETGGRPRCTLAHGAAVSSCGASSSPNT